MQRIKFIDQMAQGKLSRRKMLQSASAFGVGALMLPKLAQAEEVLTCLEWGGFDDQSYFAPYVDKHGSQPNFSIFAGEEDALAKVLAGFKADVMHPCNYSVSRFVNAGLAEPIDTSRLSHWKDLFPALQTAEGVVINDQVMMAPADWGNAAIAYRPDLIDDAFKADPSWRIFFDEAYQGKVAMVDDPFAIMLGAMSEGMSYDEAYMLRGEALTKATENWGTKAVNTARFLWSDPTEAEQAMASGEIIAAYSWNGLVKNLRGQGIPVEYARPKEGFFTWFCGLTLLNSGAADPALAYDFIDAWLSPETGKTLIDGGYGHANIKSFDLVDKADVEAMGIMDPVTMMQDSIVFKSTPDDVQTEQNKAWGDVKALKI
jgi:spermidine/putrescine transport system substrate-binding protein